MITTLTPVTRKASSNAFQRNILPHLGYPTREQSFLYSLWCIETDYGAQVVNHNWGLLAADKEWTGNVVRAPWFSKTDDPRHALMVKGLAPQKLRAYSSHTDGVEDYKTHLFKNEQELIASMKEGRLDNFVALLASRPSSGLLYTPEKLEELFGVVFAENAKL